MEHKLFLCPEKCEFYQKQIEYLRLVISENKVVMDPVKVARVREWSVLENWTDVQAFIGFINFYHCFIQDFLTIAQSLLTSLALIRLGTGVPRSRKPLNVSR